MKNQKYYIYICASKLQETFDVGVATDLKSTIWEHRSQRLKSFPQKEDDNCLVYFEHTENMNQAIARQRQLNQWNRSWKIRLIEECNPSWHDLAKDWFK